MIGKGTTDKSLSLYLHIPFCSRKCDYCHFYVLPDKAPLKVLLMEGLKLEWELIKPLLAGKKILTIYFGGGTPYLLGPAAIAEIIQWISSQVSKDEISRLEITLEANPENIEIETLKKFYAAGINRLSIGLQSLDDGQLTVLSRRHTAKKGLEAIAIAFDAGFKNISIDLMYDLPGQTLASWQRTVKCATTLPISHLSLYNLTIEPHTAFFKYRKTLEKQLPDGETSKAMYETACTHFEDAGLSQYEISAFAKEGRMALHNSGYWTGRPFLGLGPSAFSYWEGRRFSNSANLSKYVQNLRTGNSPIDFSEELPPAARRRELLAIGLRLLKGVDLVAFEREHGPLDIPCYDLLIKLKKDGYLDSIDSQWFLTKQGILFYDSIATDIVL